MRANCDRGIWRGVCGSWLTGVSSCSWRTGAAGETIRSTRGLRADWSPGAESGTDGSLTGGFAVNSASAAWRALVIRSRSSPRGCGCCCRLSKICSERLIHPRLSKGRFGKFGKLDLGSRGAIRKLAPMPQPRAAADPNPAAPPAATARHRSSVVLSPPTPLGNPQGSVICNWQSGDILIRRLQECPRKIQMSVDQQFRTVSGTSFGVERRAGRGAPGAAQRPTGARNADGLNRSWCFTGRARPARLAERLSPTLNRLIATAVQEPLSGTSCSRRLSGSPLICPIVAFGRPISAVRVGKEMFVFVRYSSFDEVKPV